jgi:hypothetical protein
MASHLVGWIITLLVTCALSSDCNDESHLVASPPFVGQLAGVGHTTMGLIGGVVASELILDDNFWKANVRLNNASNYNWASKYFHFQFFSEVKIFF